ncbi:MULTISPECIES: hypothetical protein [unclassified Frondihabitans]|uniref:hypothetical protein n=1 Tax=unclassified Frondihabitans TaxID=2626248 RepID=UPI000F4FC961|nr:MULTISPECIES: hypothetical protein [unclassified Frondihabitans]RPE78112.1 hypothetical protein EDF37_0782 [Frondihabitans sp. PhB153]RPF08393.1 hypothetical protein EDF39_0784 [Frondihabitans sp. PhB161]
MLPDERTEVDKRQALARDRLEKRIAQARKSQRSQVLSRANSAAAFEYARTVNMVDWLVTHPTERAQLEKVVKLFVNTSVTLLSNTTKPQRRRLTNQLLDHFWCDLLASIVWAIEEIQALEAIVKDRLAEMIAEKATTYLKQARASAVASHPVATDGDGPGSKPGPDPKEDLDLESAVIQGCITGVVKLALDGATKGIDDYLDTMLLQLRIAGVMICPDVTEHDLVWDHCWLPLWKAALFDATLKKFRNLVGDLAAPLTAVPSVPVPPITAGA